MRDKTERRAVVELHDVQEYANVTALHAQRARSPMRDDEPADRDAYEEGGRFVRYDSKGLAHVYDDRGERIARELDPQTMRGRESEVRDWE